MNKKFFALVFFGFLIGLFEACFCNSARTPYFDYQKLQITEWPFVHGTDTLQSFILRPDDIEYVASVYQLTLTTPTYGTSCPEPGEQGTKFTMTNVEIFADKDFDDMLTAGQSLSTLFYGVLISDPSKSILQTLPELEFELAPYSGMTIYTPYLPSDTSQVFDLTMRITKSDGSIAEGKINGVKFRSP